jgi:hypothetical protein
MEGALVVIPLVGLVFPILLLIAALLFDAVIGAWAIYRTVHDRLARHSSARDRAGAA